MRICRLCQGTNSISDESCQLNYAKCGVSSITGVKSGDKDWINQDNYLVHEDSKPLKKGRHIFAVFDGHGTNGHHVSQFCRENLLEIIETSEFDIVSAFDKLHEALQNSSFSVETSGTTCTIVIIHEGAAEVRKTFFNVTCYGYKALLNKYWILKQIQTISVIASNCS